jgi:cytochrome c peroxidase
MRKIIVINALVLLVVLMSFRKKEAALFHTPDGWPKPAYNFKKNPLTKDKIELGRRLFYDPILSKDSTVSCSSCHLQYSAFTHVDHNLSHGIEGKAGNRNSPSLMNLAWNTSFMWDGGVNHLDVQALAPITNPLEMAEDLAHVVKKLQAIPAYRGAFYKSFGDSTITGEHVLKSISQFMLTLVSSNAKYDKVMRDEEEFTAQEANGYKLFKQHCSSCHTEPLFTNGKFENNGLYVDDSLKDMGRMKISAHSDDSLKFKVPTLRNIEYSYPYMHDGRFKNLKQVLNYYVMGIKHSPTLSPQLQKGIYLNANEKVDVIAFLLTLSDKEFIQNPAYAYPMASFK